LFADKRRYGQLAAPNTATTAVWRRWTTTTAAKLQPMNCGIRIKWRN